MCIYIYIYICTHISAGSLSLDQNLSHGRFPKFHSVFLGRDPGTLKSDIVSTKTSTINLFGFEALKLKIRRLKLWKPTAHLSSPDLEVHPEAVVAGRVPASVYVYVYVYVYNKYIYIYIYRYVYMYVCVCVYIYIYIYIYTYTYQIRRQSSQVARLRASAGRSVCTIIVVV